MSKRNPWRILFVCLAWIGLVSWGLGLLTPWSYFDQPWLSLFIAYVCLSLEMIRQKRFLQNYLLWLSGSAVLIFRYNYLSWHYEWLYGIVGFVGVVSTAAFVIGLMFADSDYVRRRREVIPETESYGESFGGGPDPDKYERPRIYGKPQYRGDMTTGPGRYH